jgi:hypothetical protein
MKRLLWCVGISCLYCFVILSGCADEGVEMPPNVSKAQLLAAPDTIIVGSKKIFLTTFLWRDFMPTATTNGGPLTAVLFIAAMDSTPLQGVISVDAVWIVNGDQIWKSWTSDDPVAETSFGRHGLGKIARNGPAWAPGVTVDVIVRVFDAQEIAFLLRAPNQWISRTD